MVQGLVNLGKCGLNQSNAAFLLLGHREQNYVAACVAAVRWLLPCSVCGVAMVSYRRHVCSQAVYMHAWVLPQNRKNVPT